MTPERAAAIDAFYRTEQLRLRKTLAKTIITQDEQIYEDALSFAWLKLAERPDVTLDDRGRNWLSTVAHNEAIRRLAIDRRTEPMLGTMDERIETQPRSAAGRDPADIVEDRQRLKELEQLKPRHRAVFLLQTAGHSREDIAEKTGDTLRTVDRNVQRGRKHLDRLTVEWNRDPQQLNRDPPERDGPDLGLSL